MCTFQFSFVTRCYHVISDVLGCCIEDSKLPIAVDELLSSWKQGNEAALLPLARCLSARVSFDQSEHPIATSFSDGTLHFVATRVRNYFSFKIAFDRKTQQFGVTFESDWQGNSRMLAALIAATAFPRKNADIVVTVFRDQQKIDSYLTHACQVLAHFYTTIRSPEVHMDDYNECWLDPNILPEGVSTAPEDMLLVLPSPGVLVSSH